MYIEDHTFHIPSAPIEVRKMNPLVLTSPNASLYRRQNSSSSISSAASTASGSEFHSYSPPPSTTSSYFEGGRHSQVSRVVDLHARALLLLSLLYTHSISQSSSVINDLIHPACTFEVEHFDASTSKIDSREEYLHHWTHKVAKLGQISSRVRECCVDEGQRKVWVVNEIVVGEERKGKESVDMLTFDEEGLLVRKEAWLRRKSSSRGDED